MKIISGVIFFVLMVCFVFADASKNELRRTCLKMIFSTLLIMVCATQAILELCMSKVEFSFIFIAMTCIFIYELLNALCDQCAYVQKQFKDR